MVRNRLYPIYIDRSGRGPAGLLQSMWINTNRLYMPTGKQTIQQRIGLGVGMSVGTHNWSGASSVVSDNSPRDEYSRFGSITRRPTHTHWSQFVPPTPSP